MEAEIERVRVEKEEKEANKDFENNYAAAQKERNAEKGKLDAAKKKVDNLKKQLENEKDETIKQKLRTKIGEAETAYDTQKGEFDGKDDAFKTLAKEKMDKQQERERKEKEEEEKRMYDAVE